ncbi:MAG: hypothetical protein LBC72_05920 [Spirochaetaceae bacterium]|jgi:hypothetical protein|nr:hypothetical protein [Spirochaetaceae bacterium]
MIAKFRGAAPLLLNKKRADGARAAFVVSALWFVFLCFSCEPTVKAANREPAAAAHHPRLAALSLRTADGANLPLLDLDGKEAVFDSETFAYQIHLSAEMRALTIAAEPAEGFKMARLYPAQTFMPQQGTNSIVTVENDDGETAHYIVTFTQDELPAAALKTLLLSVGQIPGFSGEKRQYDVALPFGANSVTVYAQGDAGSFYTYNPAVTLNLENGAGTLVIGVSTPGYKVGTYTLNFTQSSAAASELEGLSLSAGAITSQTGQIAPFDSYAAGTQYISVYAGTTQLVVNAVKKRPHDVVSFSDGRRTTDGVTSVFDRPGGLDGVQFSVTVDGGLGYQQKTYQFLVRESSKPPALLLSLDVSTTHGQVSLFQRDQTGANGAGGGFDAAHFLYNLHFEHGTKDITLDVAGAPGTAVAINGEAVSSKTFLDPRAAAAPLRIDVTGPDMLPSTYAIHLIKTNPPKAELSGLVVAGGSLSRPFGKTDYQPYDVRVFSNVDSLIVLAQAAGEFSVTYGSANVLTPPLDSRLSILVDGGPDYLPAAYTLDIGVVPPQTPRLQSLTVAGQPVTLSNDALVYDVTLPGGSLGAVDVPFAWTINAAEVEAVWYSFTSGQTWLPLAAGIRGASGGFSGELALLPKHSALTLLKTKTFDGNFATYFINVHRQPVTAAVSADITYNYGFSPLSLAITDALTPIELPSFTTNLLIRVAPSGLNQAGAVTFSPALANWDGGTFEGTLVWNDADDMTPKALSMNLSDTEGRDKTFVLAFSKKSKSATQMAAGGTASFFYDAADGWQELHVFATPGAASLAIIRQPAAAAKVLVVGGGGGGGGGVPNKNGDLTGGGGGGGQFFYNGNFLITKNSYAVSVGAGGDGGNGSSTPTANPSAPQFDKVATPGKSGEKSMFDTTNAAGGGGGGKHGANNIGGAAGNGGAEKLGGGGGTNMTTSSASMNGVNGTANAITGQSRMYAGGGASADITVSAVSGTAGAGGGGAASTPGTPNTGGGGGGGRSASGGKGGSGVVIVRWRYTE